MRQWPIALCLLALGGCAEAAPLLTPSVPSTTPIAAFTESPTAREGLEACMDGPATDGGSKSETTQGVSYDHEQRTILVEAPAEASLGAVAAALGRPDLLAEIGPGEWLLSANLEIGPGATLVIAGPEVRWLKLRSDEENFVSVKARGGRLLFDNTCVSSWDASRSQVDENVADGRSFVLARDGAWMAIRRSRLHHLGYQANESYGLAWRLEGTGGEIIDSELAHNFYGLYSYQVEGLVIRGNVVRHSVLYGIDPHTASNQLVIEDNRAHHNGKHGIILAEGCSDSVIKNNVAYANQLHGIVLYNGSNNNLVEGNTVYDNGQQGINLNQASGNRLLGNTVYGNGSDGIGLGQSSADNLIAGNVARDNREHGIYLYTEARSNVIVENRVSGNGRYGIYAKSAGNRVMAGNDTTNNAVGIVARAEDLADDAHGPAQRSANREEGLRLIDD